MKKELTDRQKSIYEFIENFVQIHGYPPTLREIGKEFEIASTFGVKRHIDALVKKGYLIVEGSASRAISLVDPAEKAEEENLNVYSIPLVGRVAAGFPILAEQNIEGKLAIDHNLFSVKPDAFALKVRGDSMINAGIVEGDVVIISPQTNARNGEIIVAMLADEATLKRFIVKGGEYYLMPENDNYPLISVKNREDFTIIGVVKGVYRFYN